MPMPLQTALTLARNIEIDGRLWVTSVACVWGGVYQVTAQTMPADTLTDPYTITWNEAPGLNTPRDVSDDIDRWLERRPPQAPRFEVDP